MYGGILHKFKHRAASAECDYIPNSVDWTNIQGVGLTSKQITGITCAITLKTTIQWFAENPGQEVEAEVWYKVTASEVTGPLSGSLSANGFTQAFNNTTFSVSNNQWVTFGTQTSGDKGETIPASVTVKNNSDNDTTLDTFSASHQ